MINAIKRIGNLPKLARRKGVCHVLWRSISYGFVMKNKYWDLFRFQLIGARKNRYAKVIVNENWMYVDLDDIGISRDLLLHKKREHFSTDFLKGFLHKNDIVVDIGANIGYYALLESKLARKGYVYAIEPVPANLNLLRRNKDLNNCSNMSIFEYAISDSGTDLTMYVYEKRNQSSMIRNPQGALREQITVRTTTLNAFVDRFVSGDVSFIRMDVEGFEYNILKGGSRLLNSSKPLKMCIELHPHLMAGSDLESLLHLLREKGGFDIAGMFLDPRPADFHSLRILNKSRRIKGLPEYGSVGESFPELDELLREGFAPIVFFERS